MNYQPQILVIDDDKRLGRTIKNVLSSQGYTVFCADNGASGIQMALENRPDLILCDVRMDPIDGYQVYRILKESSVIDYIPFLFLTVCSDLEEIRFGMDLGADDYLIKPFNNDNLIRAIEKRLEKFRKLEQSGKSGFMTLFEFSTNGIFLFNQAGILDANPALLKILGLEKKEILRLKLEDLIEKDSMRKIKDRLNRCLGGIGDSFRENLNLITRQGTVSEVSVFISEYEKNPGVQLIGIVNTNNETSGESFMSCTKTEIVQMLLKENVTITSSLRKKLDDIFVHHESKQQNKFFSRREYQILKLSIDGLPMKLIADKLSISLRTVENHRAKMMEKTGSNNIVEVIIYALRNNLINI